MLKAMAAYSGFEEKDYDNIFITLDKMDKIGLEGVAVDLWGRSARQTFPICNALNGLGKSLAFPA